MLLGSKIKNIEKEVYFQYADSMYAVCYRYLGNREVAEEIMNDGFIKVFRHHNKFQTQNKGSLRNWIKKIMINECLMFLRKKNQFELIQIEENHKQISVVEADVFEHNDILNLIKNMPIGYRTVFNLFAIEGYSHGEIAKLLGIKESTSRSQLTAARNYLKEKLKKIGYERAR